MNKCDNEYDHLIKKAYAEFDGLVAMLMHKGLDMDDAMDVAQDVLVKACTKIGQLRDPDKLRAWLRRIAIRDAYKMRKKRAAEREREISYIVNESTGEETDIYDTVAAKETVEDIVCKNEREEKLLELIDSMGEEESAIFVKHHVDGYRLTEIASALEKNTSTVRCKHGRTKKKLKKVVGEAIGKGEL